MNNIEKQKNSFKPLKGQSLTLDFTKCRYIGEIHLILKDVFGLPEYYGENWDALYDCLDGRFAENKKTVVEIHGYTTLEPEIKAYCKTMLKIFDEIQRENPYVTFNLIS